MFRKKRPRRDLNLSSGQPAPTSASALAVRIVAIAVSCTKGIDESSRAEGGAELRPVAFSQLVVEFVLLLLHLADRLAFQALGPERRSAFIDALFFELQRALASGVPGMLSPKFRAQFPIEELSTVKPGVGAALSEYHLKGKVKVTMDILSHEDANERNREYASMKLVPEGDEGFRGTLFWEFAKHVSEAAVGDWKDPLMLMLAFGAARLAFEEISGDLSSWLRGSAT